MAATASMIFQKLPNLTKNRKAQDVLMFSPNLLCFDHCWSDADCDWCLTAILHDNSDQWVRRCNALVNQRRIAPTASTVMNVTVYLLRPALFRSNLAREVSGNFVSKVSRVCVTKPSTYVQCKRSFRVNTTTCSKKDVANVRQDNLPQTSFSKNGT